jgi:hypothetical protein
MKQLAALAWLVALGGCMSVPAPEIVRLAIVVENPGAVLRDTRDAGEKLSRTGRSEDVEYHLLGDAAIEPSILDLVAGRVARALPNAPRGSAIEVYRISVGFIRPPRSNAIAAPYAPGGSGLLLEGGAELFRRSANTILASSVIELRRNGERFASNNTVAVTDAVPPVAALSQAVRACLDTLEKQLSASGA